MNKKLVSIIVPVYNVEKYLRRCVESIIDQTYYNLEIILVDDGSTDKSGVFCDKYARKDSRVIVHHQENQGVSVARNKGIELATGDWIMFVDGDDWLAKDTFEKITHRIDESVDVCLFTYAKVYSQRKDIIGYKGKKNKLSKEDFIIFQKWIFNQYLFKEDYAISSPWCKVYRKEFIKKYNIQFDKEIKIGEDKLFNLKVFEYAEKGMYIDECFYNYRINEASRINRYSPNTVKNIETMLEAMQNFLDKYEKNKEFDEVYNIRISMSMMYYVLLDLCNSNNKKSYQERKRDFFQIVQKKRYATALKNVKSSIFPIRQRVLFVFIKYKLFFCIEALSRLNDFYMILVRKK